MHIKQQPILLSLQRQMPPPQLWRHDRDKTQDQGVEQTVKHNHAQQSLTQTAKLQVHCPKMQNGLSATSALKIHLQGCLIHHNPPKGSKHWHYSCYWNQKPSIIIIMDNRHTYVRTSIRGHKTWMEHYTHSHADYNIATVHCNTPWWHTYRRGQTCRKSRQFI